MSTQPVVNEVTRAEFARMREWDRAYVTRLANKGRLVLTDDGKLIKVAESEALLVQEGRVDRDGLRQHHATQRLLKQAGADGSQPTSQKSMPAGASREPLIPSRSADPSAGLYNDARAKKEQELFELARMERQKKQGELTDISGVQKCAATAATLVANGLDTMCTRLAPILAAESDPLKVMMAMQDETNRLRTDLADELARMFPTGEVSNA